MPYWHGSLKDSVLRENKQRIKIVSSLNLTLLTWKPQRKDGGDKGQGFN